MIIRFGALIVILYGLGFFLFSITLGVPADPAREADAIVAITGGAGRIERGVELLAKGEGKRMLIAGADPLVTKADLIRRLGGKKRFGKLLRRSWLGIGRHAVQRRRSQTLARPRD